jgi:DNA-binding transcriptional ArsR family regulator
MQAVTNNVFKALADPTRRAIFERLARDGEQTVHALTGAAGVSQPAVSKHLNVLKHAKLVRCRRKGRETHYRRTTAGSGASHRLDECLWRLLARPIRPPRNLLICWEGWIND